MPRCRRPAAIRGSALSSRWNRIVLGMQFRQLLLYLGRSRFCLHFRNEVLVRFDVGVDLGTMIVIVRQRCVDCRQRQRGIGRNNSSAAMFIRSRQIAMCCTLIRWPRICGFPPQKLGLTPIYSPTIGTMVGALVDPEMVEFSIMTSTYRKRDRVKG